MNETWCAVPDYEGLYEVTRTARVRRLPGFDNRGRIVHGGELNPYNDGRYLAVILWKNGQRKKIRLHVLMLTVFVGPCPPGLEALHDDDIKAHNNIENLSWGTRSQNMKDMYRNGRRKPNGKLGPRKVAA